MNKLWRRLNRRLLALALPNIAANLATPLVSAVDTSLAGHLPRPAFLGAIGVAGILFNYLYWGFGFLRMGTTGLVATAYGAQDVPRQMLWLARGLAVAVVGGVLIILLQEPIAWLSFRLLAPSPEVEAIARTYFSIRVWAAPATLGGYVLVGWWFGRQNSWLPLVLTSAASATNIIVSVSLVRLGYQTAGIAWGTVAGQYVLLVVGLSFLWARHRSLLKLSLPEPLLQLAGLRRYFALNGDLFLRTIGLLTLFALYIDAAEGFGEVALAANLILLQFISVAAYGIDGFAFATESVVGRYTGARQPSRLRISLALAFGWASLIGALAISIFWLAESSLLRLFTDLPAVQAEAARLAPWMRLYILLSAAAFVWDGAYIGWMATRELRTSMLWVLAIYVPLWWVLPQFMGLQGLWLAFITSVVVRGGIQTLWAPRLLRRVGHVET